MVQGKSRQLQKLAPHTAFRATGNKACLPRMKLHKHCLKRLSSLPGKVSAPTGKIKMGTENRGEKEGVRKRFNILNSCYHKDFKGIYLIKE